MTRVSIDTDKVTRMVTDVLRNFNDSGAHPAEMVLALGESIGRVIVAVGELGASEIVQRELLDVAIKQMTNAILASREDGHSVILMPDIKH